MIDRRNWRLLAENVVRKIERKKKDNGKGIHGFIFLNMIMNGIHIQKNNQNKMQFDPSLVNRQLLF